MKKLILLAIIPVLTACNPVQQYADSAQKVGVVKIIDSVNIEVYQDLETGCQYLSHYKGAIAPRIDADGIHMGCKGLQGDRK